MALPRWAYAVGAVLCVLGIAYFAYQFLLSAESSMSSLGAGPSTTPLNLTAPRGNVSEPRSVSGCLSSKGLAGALFLYLPDCPHSKSMMPVVESLSREGKTFTRIDMSSVGSASAVSSCLENVSDVPAFVCARTGNVIKGVATEEQLSRFYDDCVQ